ncbi:MAG: GAF domain-containing protein, partial [Methanobacteriota archaeon]
MFAVDNTTPGGSQAKQIQLLHRKIQDYERLHNILLTICSSLDIEKILNRIVQGAVSLCGADEGAILLFDPSGVHTAKTLIRKSLPTNSLLDHYLNTLLAGWVSRHQKNLTTADLVAVFGEEQIPEKYRPISSALALPLVVRGDIIGVINLIRIRTEKPFDEHEKHIMGILASQCAQFIMNARLHDELFRESSRLRREVEERYAFHDIIGRSEKMQAVFTLLERILPTDSRVLLEGETGTGKELIARVLHYNGPRKDNPFVAVDCGALPANLLESELFGYVKGAFTGAHQNKIGLMEEANGGTIFLDEIVNMPLEVQSKLLRAIETCEIRPLGSNQVRQIDVRIIAAASDDLRGRVEDGSFRQDLYYRLNVVSIHLPPLRERGEDLVILAHHFLKKMSEKYGKSIVGF